MITESVNTFRAGKYKIRIYRREPEFFDMESVSGFDKIQKEITDFITKYSFQHPKRLAELVIEKFPYLSAIEVLFFDNDKGVLVYNNEPHETKNTRRTY